jgi:hypothetical protein
MNLALDPNSISLLYLGLAESYLEESSLPNSDQE